MRSTRSICINARGIQSVIICYHHVLTNTDLSIFVYRHCSFWFFILHEVLLTVCTASLLSPSRCSYCTSKIHVDIPSYLREPSKTYCFQTLARTEVARTVQKWRIGNSISMSACGFPSISTSFELHHSCCSFFIHDAMSAFSTTYRLPRFDLVLSTTISTNIIHILSLLHGYCATTHVSSACLTAWVSSAWFVHRE